jgi:hypothetical protein
MLQSSRVPAVLSTVAPDAKSRSDVGKLPISLVVFGEETRAKANEVASSSRRRGGAVKRLWRYGVTLAMTTSLVTIVLLVTGWGSAMAAQITNVLVSNTSANPVPVQAVGTLPVHEQGTANVAVSGVVATKASDNPAIQPAEETELFTVGLGATGGGGTVYTVPTGKRLVIETATVIAQLPAGQRASTNLLINLAGATGKTGPGVGVFEIPMSESFDNGTVAICAGSLGSHMYADAGTTVDVSVDRSDGTGSGTFTVAIAGYLVNTP